MTAPEWLCSCGEPECGRSRRALKIEECAANIWEHIDEMSFEDVRDSIAALVRDLP